MSAGSKSKNKDASAKVAEAGNGTGPVGLVLISAAAGFADSAAIVTQARTALAPDDGIVDLLQNRRERLNFRTSH
jgi:hypothetical protein